MNLIEDAGALWHRLWSVRLAFLAGGLEIAENVLPFFTDFFPPHTFSILSGIVAFAAGIARLVQQKSL